MLSIILGALFSIFIFLLVLSFLVLIHEFGHFLAAKYIQVKVEEFGLGYPPRARILGKKWGTLFSLNWIPFGGFVKIYGEEPAAEGSKSQAANNKHDLFYEKPALARLLVILAGPVVNLLFGILAFGAVYSFVGIPTPLENQARIAYVFPDSPASQAGLQVNTNIIALKEGENTNSINSVEQAIDLITQHKGQTITLITSGHCQAETCQELAQEYEIYIRQDGEFDPSQEGAVGVAFQTDYPKFYPWYQMPFRGAVTGLKQSFYLIVVTLQELGKMFTNLFSHAALPEDVRGPFGIGHEVVKEHLFSDGILSVIYFSGLLSIGLAIMNLLPIPALDGGRALFVFLEKLIGKKRVNAFETQANYGGFIILLSLIILVSLRDIWRIVIDLYHFFI